MPRLDGYIPVDKEERWLNDTTPAYCFIDPNDNKEVWI